jgi:PIN domain nuclease of toxin-antitoxin system
VRLKLLLDTHIWLWSLRQTDRARCESTWGAAGLAKRALASPISRWEALILHQKGRVYLANDLDRWLAEATGPFRQAPLTHEMVAAARRLPLPQRDLADRFLAATATVLDLALGTADASLLGLGEIATLANR